MENGCRGLFFAMRNCRTLPWRCRSATVRSGQLEAFFNESAAIIQMSGAR